MESCLRIIAEFQWLLLVGIVLIWLRDEIASVAKSLAWRLKVGSAVKVASFELGATYVSPNGKFEPKSSTLQSQPDQKKRRFNERKQYYEPNRGLMLVHKVAPSSKEGQLYDILIYLIPHKDATLAPVTKVEYYFGKYWDDQLFLVTDRAHNFPIATSAYGPFVCTAELYFSDGTSCILSRYVDFEMGAFSNNTTQSAN